MAMRPVKGCWFALLAMASAANVTITGRTLYLDGQPQLLRGVAYSPVPIGSFPSPTSSLDFFTEEYRSIWERDLPRMAAIGVNAIRIYAFDHGASHVGFLDECARYNISVMGSFELAASHYDLSTELGVAHAKRDLQLQLSELAASEGHAAVLMWFVGNELNLPSAGFICDADDPSVGGSAATLGGNNTACQFDGRGLPELFGVIDEMCGLVRALGILCSSPLAEYPVPATYSAAAFASREGSTRWFLELDQLNMSHIDVWSANVYRPGGFGDWFYAAGARTTKPVLVSEYGVDAFNSAAMEEDEAAQSVMVQKLTEQLMRNTATCTFNCESNVRRRAGRREHARAPRSQRTCTETSRVCHLSVPSIPRTAGRYGRCGLLLVGRVVQGARSTIQPGQWPGQHPVVLPPRVRAIRALP